MLSCISGEINAVYKFKIVINGTNVLTDETNTTPTELSDVSVYILRRIPTQGYIKNFEF